MNFNVIEKEQVFVDDELYEQVKDDYVNSSLSVKQIREKYNITHLDWKRVSRQIRSELGLKARPKPESKHYIEVKNGVFRIHKWIDKRVLYLGTVHCSESEVQKVVEKCESVHWNIAACKQIIKECNDGCR